MQDCKSPNKHPQESTQQTMRAYLHFVGFLLPLQLTGILPGCILDHLLGGACKTTTTRKT